MANVCEEFVVKETTITYILEILLILRLLAGLHKKHSKDSYDILWRVEHGSILV